MPPAKAIPPLHLNFLSERQQDVEPYPGFVGSVSALQLSRPSVVMWTKSHWRIDDLAHLAHLSSIKRLQKAWWHTCSKDRGQCWDFTRPFNVSYSTHSHTTCGQVVSHLTSTTMSYCCHNLWLEPLNTNATNGQYWFVLLPSFWWVVAVAATTSVSFSTVFRMVCESSTIFKVKVWPTLLNPLNPLHPTRCEPVSTVEARLKSIRCPLDPSSPVEHFQIFFKIFPKLSNASGIFWHTGGHHGQCFLSIAVFSMAHPLCPGRTFSDFCCTSWRVSYTALWCLTTLYISHDAYTNVYVHILYNII